MKLRASHQTESPAFKAWFAGSLVVDKHGQPLVVYHGTNSRVDFDFFDTSRGRGFFPDGASFHVDPEGADSYARQLTSNRSRIIPVYLRVLNPADDAALRLAHKTLGREASGAQVQKFLRDLGYDGMHLGAEWLVFEPNQVKSAIGNNGTFDPSDPRITASTANQVRLLDLYDQEELENPLEALHEFVTPDLLDKDFRVLEMQPAELKRLETFKDSTTILEMYRHATREQKELVLQKMKRFDSKRVVIIAGTTLLDGYHHVMAAIKLNRSVLYINLYEQP